MADDARFKALTRDSGAFAMLAIDQRESMRAMFAATQQEPVSDAQLTGFKLAALRALTPLASAVLIDRQFGWRQAIDQQAVAPARATRRRRGHHPGLRGSHAATAASA